MFPAQLGAARAEGDHVDAAPPADRSVAEGQMANLMARAQLSAERVDPYRYAASNREDRPRADVEQPHGRRPYQRRLD